MNTRKRWKPTEIKHRLAFVTKGVVFRQRINVVLMSVTIWFTSVVRWTYCKTDPCQNKNHNLSENEHWRAGFFVNVGISVSHRVNTVLVFVASAVSPSSHSCHSRIYFSVWESRHGVGLRHSRPTPWGWRFWMMSWSVDDVIFMHMHWALEHAIRSLQTEVSLWQ